MNRSIISVTGGAILLGAIAVHNSSSANQADGRLSGVRPVVAASGVVDPDDVPGTDSEKERIVAVTGTIVDVGVTSLLIEDDGAAPVSVAVPSSAEITRNGKKVSLSEILPGDFARVDAIVDNQGRLTARVVAARKLR